MQIVATLITDNTPIKRTVLSDGTDDVAVDPNNGLQVTQNVATAYTRILSQAVVTANQTYASNVVASQMAQGKNGYHLLIQQSGTGTGYVRINVYGSSDGTTKLGHEIERFFVLCPQGGSIFPGFITGFCPFPYLMVEAYTDAIIPGGTPAITVDWMPFSGANMIPNSTETYGQNANIQGTARLRVRGSYSFTTGVMGSVATLANEGVFSLYNPSGTGMRVVLKSLRICANFTGTADATARALYLQTLSADPTLITAVTLTTQRPNDTVCPVPVTILRAEDGGDTCALDATFTRPINSWLMPNSPGSTTVYEWAAKSEDERIVLRPTQGVALVTPAAFPVGAGATILYTISVTWSEEA